MCGSSLQEVKAQRALKKAMDRVADCDVLWREVINKETVSIRELKARFSALETAWKDWILAYCRWVEAHADHRISEAKRWFPDVNRK